MHTHADVARRCPPGERSRLRSWLALCLACAAAACGGSSSPGQPDAGDPPPDSGQGGGDTRPSCEGASGARLRQVLRAHGDGTSQFIRLRDTEYGETCAFGPAADGSLRCLPAADGDPFAEGAVRYSDGGCQTRIAQLTGAGLPTPSYLRESVSDLDACAPARAAFYELGDKLPIAPDTQIFALNGESCDPLAAPAVDFYAVTADLPPESFVAGTARYTDSGRLGQLQIDGDDDSRFCDALGPLRDGEMTDGACQVQSAEDGSLRCLPAELSSRSAFRTDACADSFEVAVLDACHLDSRYVTDPALAACDLRRRVRLVEDTVAAFASTDAGCVAIADGEVHAVGASVSAFSFAQLTPQPTAAGGERLDRRDLVTSDGLRLFRFEWQDRQLGAPCAFTTAEDGAARCLPIDSPLEATARRVTRFTDSGCATAVAVGLRDTSCAGGDARFVLEDLGGRTRVYEAGAEQPGPLFRQDPAGCVEEPAEIAFYQIGDEIVPQMFVGGTEMVE
jgi:hypothetical protein